MKKILSVGIDIGTSTTQVIFSKITLKNTAGSFSIPRVEITEKKIIYRGKIYFTPLLSNQIINLEELKNIISLEYKNANIKKEDITTGAIIITGESSCKENSKPVLEALSDYAGDFVVATAGADLESILAGNGSGAASLSEEEKSCTVNFDIGGGTTNAAVFKFGKCIDAYGLNIGGRLIKFDVSGKVSYISDKLEKIIAENNINIVLSEIPNFYELKKLTDFLAEILYKLSCEIPLSTLENNLFIEHSSKENHINQITFSGGVAECVYNNEIIDSFDKCRKFGDIGPLLGQSLRLLFEEKGLDLREPKEKIRATVIGAGSHSVKLSGSTIIFDDSVLPKKNIPIVRLFETEDEDYSTIKELMVEKQKIYGNDEVAFFLKGPKTPSYSLIKEIAGQIVEFYEGKNRPILFLVENDFAKALGQTIEMFRGKTGNTICIDSVKVETGDYIDIGNSIGDIVPVAVKTLIFKI